MRALAQLATRPLTLTQPLLRSRREARAVAVRRALGHTRPARPTPREGAKQVFRELADETPLALQLGPLVSAARGTTHVFLSSDQFGLGCQVRAIATDAKLVPAPAWQLR
jgi:hypothetical protein